MDPHCFWRQNKRQNKPSNETFDAMLGNTDTIALAFANTNNSLPITIVYCQNAHGCRRKELQQTARAISHAALEVVFAHCAIALFSAYGRLNASSCTVRKIIVRTRHAMAMPTSGMNNCQTDMLKARNQNCTRRAVTQYNPTANQLR